MAHLPPSVHEATPGHRESTWFSSTLTVWFTDAEEHVNQGTIGHVWLERVFCALLLLFFAGTASAESPASEESWQKNTYQWFETIEPGGQVRVVNPYGNIYARFGGYENEVEVLATVQRLESELPELEVVFRHADGGLEVTVTPAAPAVPEGAPAPPGPGQTRDRVDLVLFVPQGAALHARTEADRIEVKGLEGDLTAESLKGDIWVRKVKGAVQASTERGQISAMLETGVTTQPQRISTVTGEIEVHLWEDANMNVTMATSGEISTDFSIRIEHRRFEEPGKHAFATVGKGGPELSLYSKRGRVRLLRMPRHFKPDQDVESKRQNPGGTDEP